MCQHLMVLELTNVFVAPNGSDKIQGTAASVDLTTNNQSVTLFYTGSNKGWQFKTNTA